MNLSCVRAGPESIEVWSGADCIANTTGQASEHQRELKKPSNIESKKGETQLGEQRMYFYRSYSNSSDSDPLANKHCT